MVIMRSPILVILNPLAGNQGWAPACKRLAEILAAGHLEARIELAKSGGDITGLAQRAVREQYPVIVAGGGDDTVNAVAAALVGTDTALGVLPLGTLNHFAKDLHIPLDLEGAARNLITEPGAVATGSFAALSMRLAYTAGYHALALWG